MFVYKINGCGFESLFSHSDHIYWYGIAVNVTGFSKDPIQLSIHRKISVSVGQFDFGVILTHSFPIHPFSTPWKHQKTLWFSHIFRG